MPLTPRDCIATPLENRDGERQGREGKDVTEGVGRDGKGKGGQGNWRDGSTRHLSRELRVPSYATVKVISFYSYLTDIYILKHTHTADRLLYLGLEVKKIKVAHTIYSITRHMVPELIPVLGSQPAGDVSHKPGCRLPLLSARPAVTPATLKRAATNFAAW